MISLDNDKVLEAFLNGASITDGHDQSTIDRECSLIKLQDNKRPLCLFIHGARYQSLNAIGIKCDGDLYLSQAAIGGVIKGEITPDSVKEYNDSVSINGIQITEWIDRDGTIHSVEVDA